MGYGKVNALQFPLLASLTDWFGFVTFNSSPLARCTTSFCFLVRFSNISHLCLDTVYRYISLTVLSARLLTYMLFSCLESCIAYALGCEVEELGAVYGTTDS